MWAGGKKFAVASLPVGMPIELVRNLSILAEQAANPEFLPLWAGQSANLSLQSEAKTLLQMLASEVSGIANPVIRWNRERGGK
jgi:nitronate monooxygenase